MEKKRVKFENGYYTCDIDITEEEWIDLLKDKKVTKNEYKFVLLMFLNEPDHASTCKEIGDIAADEWIESKYNCF